MWFDLWARSNGARVNTITHYFRIKYHIFQTIIIWYSLQQLMDTYSNTTQIRRKLITKYWLIFSMYLFNIYSYHYPHGISSTHFLNLWQRYEHKFYYQISIFFLSIPNISLSNHREGRHLYICSDDIIIIIIHRVRTLGHNPFHFEVMS
jgi:hypothetical protein